MPLSQQELADLAHFSKLKTNKVLNDIKDYGCVAAFQGKKDKHALIETELKAGCAIQNIGVGNQKKYTNRRF